MTREFCTLFDSNYAFKAIAMHRSLLSTGADFHLTAFCFDDEAKELIDRLALPNMTTVGLRELERFDPELAGTKPDRTPVEYCWTATPALPLFVFGTRPDVHEVTYLDADLLFFSDPEPLFDEMGDASVLITPHRYAPEFRHQEINGIFNVQFLVFRRDAQGMEVLRWWHDRCIEWCYYRLEDGKLGDQKYLDDWPERFQGVHVLRHPGGGLAPWNLDRHTLSRADGQVLVDGEPLVFFHFHRVRMRVDGGYDWRAHGYLGLGTAGELVYGPYLAALDAAKRRVRAVDPSFDAGLVERRGWRQRVDDARADLGVRVTRVAPGLARLRHRSVLS
jgi:hypothetical protein